MRSLLNDKVVATLQLALVWASELSFCSGDFLVVDWRPILEQSPRACRLPHGKPKRWWSGHSPVSLLPPPSIDQYTQSSDIRSQSHAAGARWCLRGPLAPNWMRLRFEGGGMGSRSGERAHPDRASPPSATVVPPPPALRGPRKAQRQGNCGSRGVGAHTNPLPTHQNVSLGGWRSARVATERGPAPPAAKHLQQLHDLPYPLHCVPSLHPLLSSQPTASLATNDGPVCSPSLLLQLSLQLLCGRPLVSRSCISVDFLPSLFSRL